MQAVRRRHPCHVPCRFIMPGQRELKLLMPQEATVSHAVLAARQRWKKDSTVSETEALFSFVDGRICVGTTRLAQLDTKSPAEVTFQVRKEETFG